MLTPITVSDFSHNEPSDQLGMLFNSYGSDKDQHGYTPIYARLIKDLTINTPISLLEIGLGTNNPTFISSMGDEGMPGASIKAFREFIPKANIYGADLDTTILFKEDRINTAFVDQTRADSYAQMCNDLGCSSFDLIFDDGLHSSETNLNTLIFAMNALRPGGWVVIEDIPERTLPIWQCANGMLDHQDGILVKANTAYLFLWNKPFY